MPTDAGPTGPVQTSEQINEAVGNRVRLAYGPIAGTVVLGLIFATVLLRHLVPEPAGLGGWLIGSATLSLCVHAALGRGARVKPMASGPIVAIVSAHEQTTTDLHACVWSILNQRGVEVQEVHVVDAGSTHHPVQPFSHPRVRWHRTTNAGGQAAARYVLDRLRPDDWDFVLILDASCVLAERSLEHQLRELSRPQVQATVGLVVARHSGRDLLSRLADLNAGAGSVLATVWHSSIRMLGFAAVRPVLYRARIPFGHSASHDKNHHAASQDQNHFAAYAALDGKIVMVPRAVAWTAVAADRRTAYRQLRSWSTSWWRVIPIALAGVDRRTGARYRLFALIHLLLVPSVIGCSLAVVAVRVGRDGGRWPAIPLYAALYLLVRYAATGLYLSRRPAMTGRRKLWTWLLLTPFEAVGQLTFVLPLKYLGLVRLGVRAWRARPEHRIASPLASTAGPGTVYYSGYLPDGNGS
ncbi:hypothetical protein GCM10010172_16350 [Paractinoplanes ferrugineus]|uniref:Glycosyltransferase 2-like domain-containing protein n=1 Tax=Paractinoplanes ferrugineus TaxID=113564 RepID=A0A919IXX6_9ACTN|nr:glycosyltransferase [Actinoplanes ferrugineus]GIE10199.1 hypothetical protein Afe05nite_20390 [Actinoplanes ferrugineus]